MSVVLASDCQVLGQRHGEVFVLQPRFGIMILSLMFIGAACMRQDQKRPPRSLAPPGNGGNGESQAAPSQAQSCLSPILPRRVRLLAEYELLNSLDDLSGVRPKFDVPAPQQILDPQSYPRLAFSNDQKSRTWDANLQLSAQSAAAAVVKDFSPSKRTALGCDGDTLAEACVNKVGARAFRRPLSSEETADLLSLGNFAALITFIVQSPDFLYRTEIGSASAGAKMTDYEIATALAYLLSGYPPDNELRELATQGRLQEAEVRRNQAKRLLATAADGRHERALLRFFVEWLELAQAKAARKDGNYNGPELYQKATQSLEERLGSADISLERLLGSSSERTSILLEPAFIAAHSNQSTTSPVKIGKTIARNLLCLDLPPPPANVNTALKADPALKTTRAQLEAHTNNPACSSCHSRIDPFGFAFEGFNHLGLARILEQGEPVQTAVQLGIGLSFDGSYAGATDLVARLAASPEAAKCFDSFFQQYAYGAISCEAQAITGSTSLHEYVLNFVAADRFVTRQ